MFDRITKYLVVAEILYIFVVERISESETKSNNKHESKKGIMDDGRHPDLRRYGLHIL